MPAWVVEFYEEDNGCPVREFLEGLESPRRAKILAIVKLLEEYGPTLPFPYSSQVDGKIRELRTHYGDEHYRILYFGSVDRTFILLHAFAKRTKQTPPGEIHIAVERMQRSLEKKRKQKRRRQ